MWKLKSEINYKLTLHTKRRVLLSKYRPVRQFDQIEMKKKKKKKKVLVKVRLAVARLFCSVLKLMVPFDWLQLCGPRQANLVLIAYASSEGSGEAAHPRSLARTFAARSYK